MFDPGTASYLFGLAVAIAGGFFGAAIGGNFAFAITGFTVLTSFGIYLGTESTAGFTYLAFGPFAGPLSPSPAAWAPQHTLLGADTPTARTLPVRWRG